MLSRFYWCSRPLPLVGFAAMLFVLLSLLTLLWVISRVSPVAAQVGSCSAGIVSDDFTAATLDPAWTFVNPNNDASLHLDGANLQISVPAGPDHSIWLGGLQAPRIMQPADNTDFTLEAKFDTVPTLAAQLQGLLVQANATDYIRFDITSDHDNDGVHLFAISFASGTPTVRVNQHLTAPDLPIWLRVTRSGNTWTLASSNDGTTWQTAGSFSFTLPVSQVGVFAGNEGTYPAPAPAFTASVDFFATVSCPGQPDDPDGCAQVTVPFTGGPVAAAASRPFTGTTAITVTGTGQALGTQQSDAFHVFTSVDDFVSDDFLSTTLDARWSFLDPRDDSSLTLDGTRLQFNVPSGTSHDVWSGGNFAPRVLQPMDDADFELEAKFETLPSQQYQLQGILVEAASDDYIRFDTYSDGTNLRIFAATFDPNPTVKISEVIASPTTPFYLRVARSGDVWTMTYSFDRQTWHSPTGHTFAHALAVSQAGLFAGNAGSSPPAFTAQFDYLVNLACPGNPDDQHPLRPTECATQPQDGTLWINGAPATALLPGQQAPTYRADHTYQVTIEAAGEPLVFGVGDSNVRDNSGSYEVTICPATSASPLTTTTRLSAGFAHTCHIDATGSLVCWGDDSYGQRTNLPTDTDFVQISAGHHHTCALRQVVQRLLGQLLGREILQHGTTGGPKGIAEGGDLPERGEGQEEEAEEIVLLTRQVLHQVAAKAREALEWRIAQVKLKGRGQIASKTHPFGDQEGIQAVGLGQCAIVGAEAGHQKRVEHIQPGVQRLQGRSLHQGTGQVPPEQAGGFDAQAQVGDLGLGTAVGQASNQGVRACLRVRHRPAGARSVIVGTHQTDMYVGLTDIQSSIPNGHSIILSGWPNPPGPHDRATVSRVIRTHRREPGQCPECWPCCCSEPASRRTNNLRVRSNGRARRLQSLQSGRTAGEASSLSGHPVKRVSFTAIASHGQVRLSTGEREQPRSWT